MTGRSSDAMRKSHVARVSLELVGGQGVSANQEEAQASPGLRLDRRCNQPLHECGP